MSTKRSGTMSKQNKEIKMPVENTRTEILKYLLSEDLGALDLKEKLGINESAVRRHLKILEEKQYINHYYEKASRGRPKKIFELTPKGKKLFPKQNKMLISIIINKIKEKYSNEEVKEIINEVENELNKNISIENENLSLEKKINKTLNTFDELGFFPTKKKKNGNYVLEYKNCAFGEVSEDLGNELCRMHRDVVKNSLGEVEIELEDWILSGDKVCRQIVKPK